MFIQQLTVTNYRSLRNVHIGGLTPIVVFYGNNDSGKSNILSFLYHLFKQKFEKPDILPDGKEGPSKPIGFWRGEINDFADNFYKNQPDPITFTVIIRFTRAEISLLASMPEFTNQLSEDNQNVNLAINGQIEPVGKDRGRIDLIGAKLNNKSFYELKNAEPQYLSGFGLTTAQSLDAFTKVMSSLDDAFLRIPTSRFITKEREMPREEVADLQATTFKNWLFQISVDREAQAFFRRISDQFANEPFSHGRLSFARLEEIIEVLVEDAEGLKLPLGRKGTGVQQLLMILAYVVVFEAPFVGIEEIEINLSPRSQGSIFNTVRGIVENGGPIKQVFMTTHSPLIARRNEATCRGVWINDESETSVAIPSAAEVEEFFRFPQ